MVKIFHNISGIKFAGDREKRGCKSKNFSKRRRNSEFIDFFKKYTNIIILFRQELKAKVLILLNYK